MPAFGPYQPVLKQQKEKVEMALPESQEAGTCQDIHPPPKKIYQALLRHLGAAETAKLKRSQDTSLQKQSKYCRYHWGTQLMLKTQPGCKNTAQMIRMRQN